LRAFAVIARSAGHGMIPLRRGSAASFPRKINSRKFIEIPREFIYIYRNFRKFDLWQCASSHVAILAHPLSGFEEAHAPSNHPSPVGFHLILSRRVGRLQIAASPSVSGPSGN